MSSAIAGLYQNRFEFVQETAGKDGIPWYLAILRLMEAGGLAPPYGWQGMPRTPSWFQNPYR